MDSSVLLCSPATSCRRSLPSAHLAVVVALHPTPRTLLPLRALELLPCLSLQQQAGPGVGSLLKKSVPDSTSSTPLFFCLKLSYLLSSVLSHISLLHSDNKNLRDLPNPSFPSLPNSSL